jgi:hypothetical protein
MPPPDRRGSAVTGAIGFNTSARGALVILTGSGRFCTAASLGGASFPGAVMGGDSSVQMLKAFEVNEVPVSPVSGVTPEGVGGGLSVFMVVTSFEFRAAWPGSMRKSPDYSVSL